MNLYMKNMWGKIDKDGRRRKGRQKRKWMDSVNVDLLGRRDCRGRRHKTGMGACYLSETSTPHRSGKRCDGKRN